MNKRFTLDGSPSSHRLARGAGIPRLQRQSAIFSVREARFLQIEIALDVAPGLVGDLAIAQQHVDEFALGGDQFPRQLGSRHRGVVRVGVERIRQLV